MIPKDQPNAPFIAPTPPSFLIRPRRGGADRRQTQLRLVSGGIAMTPGGRLWATWLRHGETRFATLWPLTAMTTGKAGRGRYLRSRPAIQWDAADHLVHNFWTAPDGQLFWIYDSSARLFDGEAGVSSPFAENRMTRPWGRTSGSGTATRSIKPLVRANGEWLAGRSRCGPTRATTCLALNYPCVVGFDELEAERRVHILASADRTKLAAARASASKSGR